MNPEEYGRMYDAEERQWWYAGMRAISRSLAASATAAPHARPRLLDAGCGTGVNLQHLRDLGTPVGIDLSRDALAFCQKRGVTAVQGSVLALPFPDGAFDWVTSFDVLYHRWVTDDVAAASELARVLAPGGHLLLRVPALKILWGAHDEAVHSRHRYTTADVRTLLAKAGLTPVRVTYVNSLLFPLLLVRRFLDRALDRHGSDVGFLPAPLETAFRALLGIEAAVVRRGFSFPVGASVMALARKPPAAAAPLESGR